MFIQFQKFGDISLPQKTHTKIQPNIGSNMDMFQLINTQLFWICIFDAWKKFQKIFSQMVVLDGDFHPMGSQSFNRQITNNNKVKENMRISPNWINFPPQMFGVNIKKSTNVFGSPSTSRLGVLAPFLLLKNNPRQEDTLPKEFSRLGEFSQQSLPCRDRVMRKGPSNKNKALLLTVDGWKTSEEKPPGMVLKPWKQW